MSLYFSSTISKKLLITSSNSLNIFFWSFVCSYLSSAYFKSFSCDSIELISEICCFSSLASSKSFPVKALKYSKILKVSYCSTSTIFSNTGKTFIEKFSFFLIFSLSLSFSLKIVLSSSSRVDTVLPLELRHPIFSII